MNQIDRSYKVLKTYTHDDRHSFPHSTSKASASRIIEHHPIHSKGEDSSDESTNREFIHGLIAETQLLDDIMPDPRLEDSNQKSPSSAEEIVPKKVKKSFMTKTAEPRPVPAAWEKVSNPPVVNSLPLKKEAEGEFALPSNVRDKHAEGFKKTLTPYKAFQQFFPEAYWEQIHLHSTDFFVTQIKPLIPKSSGVNPPTLQEVKRYVALYLWMGICKYPFLKAHWSPNTMYQNNFAKIMTYQRWAILDKIFHVTESNVSTKQDQFCKIRPFITLFQNKFTELGKISEISSLGIAQLASPDYDCYLMCNPFTGYCYFFNPFTSGSGPSIRNSDSKPSMIKATLVPPENQLEASKKKPELQGSEKKRREDEKQEDRRSLNKDAEFAEPPPRKVKKKRVLVQSDEEPEQAARKEQEDVDHKMLQRIQMWENAQSERNRKMVDEDGLEDNSSEVFIEMPREFDYYVGPIRHYDAKTLQRLPLVSKKMMIENMLKKQAESEKSQEPPKQSTKKYQSESDSSISSSESEDEKIRRERKRERKEKKKQRKMQKQQQIELTRENVFEFDREESQKRDRRSFQPIAKPSREESYQINLNILEESKDDAFKSHIEEDLDLLKRRYFKDKDNDSDSDSHPYHNRKLDKSLEERLKSKVGLDSAKKRNRDEMENAARRNSLLEEVYKKKIEKLRQDRNKTMFESDDEEDRTLDDENSKSKMTEKAREENENRLIGKYLSKNEEAPKIISKSVTKESTSKETLVMKMAPPKRLTEEDKAIIKDEDEDKHDGGILALLSHKFESQNLQLFVKNIQLSSDTIDKYAQKDMKICGNVSLNRVSDFPQELHQANGEAYFVSKKHSASIYLGNSIDYPEPVYSSVHTQHSVLDDGKDKISTVAKEFQIYSDGVQKCLENVLKYENPHKIAKSWKNLFFYILRLTINNANIYFNAMTGQNMASYEFYESLVQELVGEIDLTAEVKGAATATPSIANFMQPAEQHFAEFIADGRKLVRCKQGNCSNMTMLGCLKCGNKQEPVPLCVPVCFKIYHGSH